MRHENEKQTENNHGGDWSIGRDENPVWQLIEIETETLPSTRI